MLFNILNAIATSGYKAFMLHKNRGTMNRYRIKVVM